MTGARCTRVAFIKPGAIVADWRNGLVDGVLLRTLKLSDPTGERFRCGLELVAARGATVRNVRASGIEILARARDSGVVHTAAVKLMLMNKGAPATIEDVDLQVKFTDPYAGVPHGAHAPGYPVDHIAWFGRINSAKGSMSGIAVDLEGRGTGFGGIVVGSGLDDAITVRRAILQSVGVSPRSSVGGGGIWSNSRLKLGEVQVDSVKLPAFGGSAFRKPRT